MAQTNKRGIVEILKNALLCLLLACSIVELVFYPSEENIVGIAVTFMSTYIFFYSAFNMRIVKERIISFIALLSLFLFMYLPLPLRLLDGKGMSDGLFNPILTYTLQLLYFCVACFSFHLAGNLHSLRNNLRGLLIRGGYFFTPSVKQLWILGAIGLAFRLTLLTRETNAGAGTLSIFASFIYAPICILFLPLMAGKECSPVQKKYVYVYIAFLSVFLISTNSRSGMMSSIMIFVTCFLIKKFYETRGAASTIISKKMIVIAVVAILLLSGPLADMGTAMLITRSVRKDLSYSELLYKTIETYQDKDAIALYRKIASKKTIDGGQYTNSIDWKESYVSNLFLDRFCNYRVVDATIFHAYRSGLGNAKMQDDFITRLKATFPTPMATFLFGKIDKKKIAFSSMDKLYAVSRNFGTLGGYKVGGDVGLGLSVFSYAYYIIVFIVYLLLFVIMDSVIIYRKDKVLFSVFTLLDIYFTYFLMFTVAGGIVGHVQYLIWGFFISTICRLLVYRVTRVFS